MQWYLPSLNPKKEKKTQMLGDILNKVYNAYR